MEKLSYKQIDILKMIEQNHFSIEADFSVTIYLYNFLYFVGLDSTRFQQNTDVRFNIYVIFMQTKPMISLTLVGIIWEDWKKNKWVTFVSSNETLFDCSKGGSFRFQEMQKMIIENQLFPTILLYK